MRTFARIQDGRVVELVITCSDISTMFHPALMWVDASSVAGVAEGWTYDGLVFSKSVTLAVAPSILSIVGMQAQLAMFAAQLAALTDSA